MNIGTMPTGIEPCCKIKLGNITTWVYDALSRVVEERDPFYNLAFASIDAAVADLANPSGANAASNAGAEHVSVSAYTPEGNLAKTIDRNGRHK
ncbi:MAG: hypothetical protein R3C53_14825 [Pirellulaceae bacterium]